MLQNCVEPLLLRGNNFTYLNRAARTAPRWWRGWGRLEAAGARARGRPEARGSWTTHRSETGSGDGGGGYLCGGGRALRRLDSPANRAPAAVWNRSVAAMVQIPRAWGIRGREGGRRGVGRRACGESVARPRHLVHAPSRGGSSEWGEGRREMGRAARRHPRRPSIRRGRR